MEGVRNDTVMPARASRLQKWVVFECNLSVRRWQPKTLAVPPSSHTEMLAALFSNRLTAAVCRLIRFAHISLDKALGLAAGNSGFVRKVRCRKVGRKGDDLGRKE